MMIEETLPPPPLSVWDAAGMMGGFLFTLTVTYILSHKRIFWEDEMLGWMLLRDPSWKHMVQAWNIGADGGGFAFYLTGRAWFSIFGPSEVSFRLYTSTCFGLAFAVMWAAARRFYATGIVAFALLNSFFFSPVVVMHMTEGRFYGLEVLAAALTVWLAFHVADKKERISGPIYLAMFFTHALLTASHILGVVYSAFILLAIISVDLLRRRLRPLLYLSAALLLAAPAAGTQGDSRVCKRWEAAFLDYAAYSARSPLSL